MKSSLALAYACNPFGADHMSSEHDSSIMERPIQESLVSLGFVEDVDPNVFNFEKAKLFFYTQKAYSILDTLDLCMFCFGFWSIYKMNHVVDLLNAATGWTTTLWELMLVGERRIHLMRAFNAREGFHEGHDLLPERIYQPLVGGLTEGQFIDYSLFLDLRREYYQMAGLDPKTGRPIEQKLKELRLSFVLEELKDKGLL